MSGLRKLVIHKPLDLTEAIIPRKRRCCNPSMLLPAAVPHLRHLEMECTTSEFAHAALSRILGVAPRLASLVLCVGGDAAEAPLVQILREADAVGVRTIRIRLLGLFPDVAMTMRRLQLLSLHCDLSVRCF